MIGPACSIRPSTSGCQQAKARATSSRLALTRGGPVDASETLATQIYKQTFAFGRFGYGTALSLILTVLITVLAVAQLLILRARERRL